ncbi:PhzF family phenazine biosynthesis protein [Marinomonas sp. M1K-6]|uniref:PhzF family phenazine biosynthesis protein n=1 Tax=Marinomonas profundi TaxID=2726122 RepID=A0A847QYS8_9GAMM|nr:PhzF family phenazine biosynthesis protein [Marinomonas profundi]NLQ18289.1 PhzF family phenazine biosynthesis protein [Marinomonas profundi]UDV02352.1 PhzF family phenazine biosynthesis protein [Marinomonas profundi]
MAQVDVYLVRAFSISGQGGNLAGVVLQADALTDQQKQAIAKAVGVSETAFVSQSDKADFQLSFFTPTVEVDFCGHATLSAFWLLHHLQKIPLGNYQQETKVGVLDVEVASNCGVLMSQSLPVWLTEFSAEEIAPMLGIDPQLIVQLGLPIQAVSTGLVDVMIPVPYGALDCLVVDLEAITRFCQQHQCVGFHVFEMNSPDEPYTANCRNFAPAVGIPEESATGSSSGALACYLNRHFGSQQAVFEQGRAMNMSSRIVTQLRVESGELVCVQVGGEGAMYKVMSFEF